MSKIKKALSPRLKAAIKMILAKTDQLLVARCADSRLLTWVYYNCLGSAFSREQFAVLSGRARHLHEREHPGESNAQLRRNIHRLEKALIMRPRRAVFAKDYIAETVRLFCRCQANTAFDGNELTWASSVLTEYFSAVQLDTELLVLQQTFMQTNNLLQAANSTGLRYAPYPAGAKEQPEIASQQLAEFMWYRSSIRWFLPQSVSPDLILRAVDMARSAPSACNRQPFFVKATLEPTRAATLAELAMGTVGFSHNIPALLVLVGDLSCYEAERDRHVIYIDTSLFAMQLMLALQSVGLASCPINWPDVEPLERRMKDELELEAYQRPVMLLAVGYADPAGGVPASVKKTAAQLIQWVEDDYRN